MSQPSVIVLLTDFGLKDAYVGIMKGVILSKSPNARVVDLIHSIPPQGVRMAAYHLLVSYKYFPVGSVFVCVVDPGVGSERQVLAIKTDRHTFLAPDNGLLSWVLQNEKIRMSVYVKNQRILLPKISATFHGRDVFAPAAAYLAKGGRLENLGPVTGRYQKHAFPLPIRRKGTWKGEVLVIDHFGNLVTNLMGKRFHPKYICLTRDKIPCVSHYAAVPQGRLLALVGSSGYWEISVRNGSAARRLKGKVGMAVTCK